MQPEDLQRYYELPKTGCIIADNEIETNIKLLLIYSKKYYMAPLP